MSESVTLQNFNHGWFDTLNFSWWYDTIQFVRTGNLPIIMRSRVFLSHYLWDVFLIILVFNLSQCHWFLRSHHFNQRIMFIFYRISLSVTLAVYQKPCITRFVHIIMRLFDNLWITCKYRYVSWKKFLLHQNTPLTIVW